MTATKSVVAIGGGTGLAVLLRGLKQHAASGEIGRLSAVVTMSDDGGSSGRLRREYGVLPPGDIRNCIVALADDEDLLARLFQYRFPDGGGLSGHSFGNLFLTALTGITGDFYQAILTAESILSVRGKIYPATLHDVRLLAVGASGRRYEGESAVGRAGEPLTDLALEPPSVAAFPAAVEALEVRRPDPSRPGLALHLDPAEPADSRNTRRVPRQSRAPQDPAHESDDPTRRDRPPLRPRPSGGARTPRRSRFDRRRPGQRHAVLDRSVSRLYAAAGAEPVMVEAAAFEDHRVAVVQTDLLGPGDLIRHDPRKLGDQVLALGEALRARQG